MVDFVPNLAIRTNGMQKREAIHDMPRASVYRVAAQVVSSGTLFPAGFDTVEYDVEGMWSAVSPSSFACRTAGLWRVTGWWTWDVSAAGQRGLLIYRTTTAGTQTLYPGNGILAEGHSIPSNGGGLTTPHGPLSYDIDLDAGDTVTMRVSQFTGGNLSITPATSANRYNGFQACLIST